MLFAICHQPFASARVQIRRVAAVVLFLLVAAQAFAVAGETLLSNAVSDELSQSTGFGSHSEDDGGPCDPSCPCACCPGHSVVKALSSSGVNLQLPPPQAIEAAGVAELQPAEVIDRIFHPPRA
jgi:hypothetical protein